MSNLMAQEDLAELLGVEVRTLRQWRQTDFMELPKYLPCVTKAKKTEKSFYDPETILKWLEKNPEYQDRVLAALAPERLRQALLPGAMAAQSISSLRNQPQPVATGAGLFGIQ